MNEVEYTIIGTLLSGLIYVEPWRKMIEDGKIKPDFFQDNSARQAFEKVMSIDTNDVNILSREVRSLVGVEFVEKACEKAAANEKDAYRVISKFATDTMRKRLRNNIEEQFRFAGGKTSMPFLVSSIRGELDKFEADLPKDETLDGISIKDLADPIPEDENPNALFRDGWLRKGNPMFLVSVSGSGKSVITMQLCYSWALGRAVLGTEPIRPMKIAIFQTEDDMDELSEFRDSMRRGYRRIHNWTDDDLDAAEQRVRFFDPQCRMGDEFIEYFRAVQEKHHFDLVVINPLQGVTGFDLNKNENLTNFFRKGLDSVIKNEKTKCGLFIIHHTNKPPSAKERINVARDKFAQYLGAGGAEINNWQRGVNIIMPTSDNDDCFMFVAAKRGKRLHWKKLPQLKEVLPTKIISHSEPDPDGKPLLFWLDKSDDFARAKDAADAAMAATPEENAKKLVAELQGQRLGATELRAECCRRFHRKTGTDVYNYICENSRKLNVNIESGTNNRQQFYCFPELTEKQE